MAIPTGDLIRRISSETKLLEYHHPVELRAHMVEHLRVEDPHHRMFEYWVIRNVPGLILPTVMAKPVLAVSQSVPEAYRPLVLHFELWAEYLRDSDGTLRGGIVPPLNAELRLAQASLPAMEMDDYFRWRCGHYTAMSDQVRGAYPDWEGRAEDYLDLRRHLEAVTAGWNAMPAVNPR